ncbi:MAG: DNA-binding protein [Negativicutes bacterium]|nr:DNA-binding protein [Negativicutes bacterium]
MNFLTATDIEELLKLSHRQAKALMRTDGFPSIQIGREYRVEQERFEEWLEETKGIKLDYSKC